MRIRLFAFVLFSFVASANAQVYKYVEKIPSFSLSAGSSYLVDAKDYGAFLKYYLPTSNGFAFYAQGVSLFPRHQIYKEYRLEYGLEIVFFKVGGFSMHALSGFNYGWWQRKDEFSAYFKNGQQLKDYIQEKSFPADTTIGNHFHKDNSYFIGGGMDFEFNKYCSLYASWKGYPQIFVSYAEAGVRFNIYPSDNRKMRKRYSKNLKSLIK